MGAEKSTLKKGPSKRAQGSVAHFGSYVLGGIIRSVQDMSAVELPGSQVS